MHASATLAFFNDLAPLADPAAFKAHLGPPRRAKWVVYAKRPFGGPEAVLAYLARYTHRVAIANSRLITLNDRGVTFRWKDYRARSGPVDDSWIKTMTLPAVEFLRRFLLHVLPDGFHRIRRYGFLASARRAANIDHIKGLLGLADDEAPSAIANEAPRPETEEKPPCPCCGGGMRVIETFTRGQRPRLSGIAADFQLGLR